MADQSKPSRKTVLILTTLATALQLAVMVLLTIDKMRVSLAISILGLIIIFGLLPAMAFIKSQK